MQTAVNRQRIHDFTGVIPNPGPIVYWMDRDKRVSDNWALLHALDLGGRLRSPVIAATVIDPRAMLVTDRRLTFLAQGLEETAQQLSSLNVPLVVLGGNMVETIAGFMNDVSARTLILDFSPLHYKQKAVLELRENPDWAIIEIDAHNIVPCRVASPKQEYAAYTLRPKLHARLDEFLTDFPLAQPQSIAYSGNLPKTNWTKLRNQLSPDATVPEAPRFEGGESVAKKLVNDFIRYRLSDYDRFRNDPLKAIASNLSPYINFGFISAQRVALEIMHAPVAPESRDAFLEQLIIRRELSDNFCLYNAAYDTFDGFPEWAKTSHDNHRLDPRPYVYTTAQFDKAETHEPLWNAAQMEMVTTGKMHGYLRMYWAKKILEWSPSPEQAIDTANFLNDTYSLDGCDPNGYAGTAWSIGGVHDRPWPQRDVFGAVRYMNTAGCFRKFDAKAYIGKYAGKKSGSLL